MVLKQFCLATILWVQSAAVASATSAEEAARLIRHAEPRVQDARGWATDLVDVLRLHDLDTSKENICAAIAVIDQESSFVADPPVAGLGALSEAALRTKLDRIPLGGTMAITWLANNPTPDASFLSRIRTARTERDLDLAYRSLVEHAGQKSGLDPVLRLGVFNRIIEERNEIDTAGSMQVSVKFAIDMARRRRWLPMMLDDVYAVRDQLYTRHGGMYYGVPQLLAYETGYSNKIYRFADFNAGRYASRNAAFQKVIAKLSGETLAFDGDILAYDKNGVPLRGTTSTERALRTAIQKAGLAIDNKALRRDLLLEKTKDFDQTPVFTMLRKAFATRFGITPPFAEVPDIALKSPKIRRVMTTRIFAERVNTRYQACMKAR